MPDVKKEVESLLFSSGRAMLEKDLADIIGVRPKDVQKAIEQIKKDYDERDTSLTLMQTAEGWKLNVKEKYVSLVTKIVADTELPFPLLETLSVIAFKAPAMQAEVIKIRGTNAYEHVQALIDAGFIERIKKGRSFSLGLTPKFFDYFDVEGEKSLKMLLKGVKPGEPKRKKLGNLSVVDVAADEQKTGEARPPVQGGKFGDLDVVDVATQSPAAKKPNPFKPDNDFLDELDSKISQLSKKNDENDEDETFKKPEGIEGEPQGEGEDFAPGENKKTNEIFGDHTEGKKQKGDYSREDKQETNDDADSEKESKDPLDEEDKVEI